MNKIEAIDAAVNLFKYSEFSRIKFYSIRLSFKLYPQKNKSNGLGELPISLNLFTMMNFSFNFIMLGVWFVLSTNMIS